MGKIQCVIMPLLKQKPAYLKLIVAYMLFQLIVTTTLEGTCFYYYPMHFRDEEVELREVETNSRLLREALTELEFQFRFWQPTKPRNQKHDKS